MALTDLQIKRFSPATKPYKRADGGGLFIQVMPNNSKLWRMGHEKPATTWTSYGRVESHRTAEIMKHLSETDRSPMNQESPEDLVAKLARHFSVDLK